MWFSKPSESMNSFPMRGGLPSHRVTCSTVKVDTESLEKLLHTLLFYHAVGKKKRNGSFCFLLLGSQRSMATKDYPYPLGVAK